MMDGFSALHRVKKMREESALSALRNQRAELSRATLLRDDCIANVKESAAAIPDREAALYADIMSKVIGTGAVEQVREKLALVHQAHRELEDELEFATEQCIRFEQEVEAAHRVYQLAQRKQEKYSNLLEDFALKMKSMADASEEKEMDDIHMRGVRTT